MDRQQYEHYDDKLLNELNIVEVARRLNLKLHRAGAYFKTNCLWHPDSNPSLMLYNKTGDQHCHCYSCGETHTVISLAMKAGDWTFQKACEWLSREFGIGTIKSWNYIPAPQPRVAETTPPKEYQYIPMKMIDPLVSVESSLCHCLMRMAHAKDALWTPEAIEWQVEEYRLGCYSLWGKDDWTVYPCIDYWGRVCNLKVQHYDTTPGSASFGHDDIGNSYWLASMWLKDGKLKPESGKKVEDVSFRNNCLFGEHLLKRYPSTQVALVESPKNAIFGALAFPEMVWIAAGNKHNLNREVLEPLRNREVLAIPDRDAIPLWTSTLEGMRDLANFTVSDFCEHHAPEEQLKFDIADYLQGDFHGLLSDAK